MLLFVIKAEQDQFVHFAGHISREQCRHLFIDVTAVFEDSSDGGTAQVTPPVAYGAFAGYGRQANDWGLRRGNWDQGEATIGGFVGWHADSGAWVNGQVLNIDGGAVLR